MTKRTTGISMEEDKFDRIDEDLSFGDYRSHWIVDAVDLRIAVDDILDQFDYEFESSEKKNRFVANAVLEKAQAEHAKA